MPTPDPKPATQIILRFADGTAKRTHLDLGSVEPTIERDSKRFAATGKYDDSGAEYYDEVSDTK